MLLNGCVNPPQLYCVDSSYTDAMYKYLKDDEATLDEQMEDMTEYFENCKTYNEAPAPGSYAHQGLLYSKTGNNAKAEEYFILEKQHFPESTAYIDFLLKKKAESSNK